MYGLASICLNASERRRIDGFYCRCLRGVWGIKHAYVSRISNAAVLEVAQQNPITDLMAKQQLTLDGRIARATSGSLLRDCAFTPGCLQSACDRYVRRVGRPTLEWVTHVQNMALKHTGSMHGLERHIYAEEAWRKFVCSLV